MAAVVAAAVLAFVVTPSVYGDVEHIAPTSAGIMDPEETLLFELINEARRNPLGTAATLGMDPARILADFPEHSKFLRHGMPELTPDVRLCKAARKHAADMLVNNYYAYESIDGRTPWQRMRDEGYVAAVAEESLGLLFFNNFISPETAVGRIFVNRFRDELNPARSGMRGMLNPELVEIGVGIGGGLYQISGFSGNVYLAVCDFGIPVEGYELELFELINQMRARPVDVSRSLGIEPAAILGLFPEYGDFFAKGLPPLVFNRKLRAAADVKITDMLENGYWANVSPEGVTPAMRIRQQGYAPSWTAESRIRLSTCATAISPEKTVSVIFQNMFFNVFRSSGFRDANLLAEKAADIGIRVVSAESKKLSGLCGENVHIAVFDFAAPAKPEGPVVTGVVYEDLNGNNLYDAGEGVPDVEITVRIPGGVIARTAKTNAAGGYAIPLEPGRYRVSIGEKENIRFRWITVETGNVRLAFEMPAGMVSVDDVSKL